METLHAALPTALSLVLQTPNGDVTLSLRTWPASALADLVDKLPLWGVGCEFGNHHRHHRRRGARHRPNP